MRRLFHQSTHVFDIAAIGSELALPLSRDTAPRPRLVSSSTSSRMARRITVGLARMGGHGYDSSGDIFLALSTRNHLPVSGEPWRVEAIPNRQQSYRFGCVHLHDGVVNGDGR
ncbi:MAG TPA: P1 family peptidase [Acidimicrobiia bacterium]